MPLDYVSNLIDQVPENLQFDVHFEPTKVRDKKYVINGDTGEYIGVVGDTFNCASHKDFFHGVQDTMTETLSSDGNCKMLKCHGNVQGRMRGH